MSIIALAKNYVHYNTGNNFSVLRLYIKSPKIKNKKRVIALDSEFTVDIDNLADKTWDNFTKVADNFTTLDETYFKHLFTIV